MAKRAKHKKHVLPRHCEAFIPTSDPVFIGDRGYKIAVQSGYRLCLHGGDKLVVALATGVQHKDKRR